MAKQQAVKTTATNEQSPLDMAIDSSVERFDSQLVKIEEVLKQTELAQYDGIRQAFQTADAIQKLREFITNDMMHSVMQLMNTPLGFLTDRDPSRPGKDGKKTTPYSDAIVKDCVIQALLRGLAIIGNEFNIIAGKCYVTKEGMRKLILKQPGIKQLRFIPEVPVSSTGGALVGCTVDWNESGEANGLICCKSDESDTRIPVRVNAGMGTDAILGKAERKAYARVYQMITGQSACDGDAEEPVAGPSKAADTISRVTQLVKEFAACESLQDSSELYKALQEADFYPSFADRIDGLYETNVKRFS